MSGALSETTFNFFGKMKFMRLYDGILATPIRPIEIALGEPRPGQERDQEGTPPDDIVRQGAQPLP